MGEIHSKAINHAKISGIYPYTSNIWEKYPLWHRAIWTANNKVCLLKKQPLILFKYVFHVTAVCSRGIQLSIISWIKTRETINWFKNIQKNNIYHVYLVTATFAYRNYGRTDSAWWTPNYRLIVRWLQVVLFWTHFLLLNHLY